MDENKKIYFGYFKCRMCGKEFFNFSVPTWEMALDKMSYRDDTDYHYHDDNSKGYADFIGFRYEEAR